MIGRCRFTSSPQLRIEKQVDEFYHSALAAGGKDNGPPRIRSHYHANYYAAFGIGPDAHNVEAACRRPESKRARLLRCLTIPVTPAAPNRPVQLDCGRVRKSEPNSRSLT